MENSFLLEWRISLIIFFKTTFPLTVVLDYVVVLVLVKPYGSFFLLEYCFKRPISCRRRRR